MSGLVAMLVMWLATSASAAEVGRLPFGAAVQLGECLDGKVESCGGAAADLGAGWKAFLTRAGPGGLSGDELRLYEGLTCAERSDAAACGSLGRALLAERRPLAGAVLLVRACFGGDGAARESVGPCDRGFESTIASPTDDELVAHGLRSGTAVSEATLRKLATACDKENARACLGLGRAAAVAARSDATEGLFHLRVEAVCNARGGAACELLSHLDEPAVPPVPSLRTAERVLGAACESFGGACRLDAQVRELGSVQVWGSAESQATFLLGCDLGAKDACKRADAIDLQSGQLSRLDGRCDAAIAAGTDALVCAIPVSAQRYGVGRTKDVAGAAALERRACDAGSWLACRHAADTAWDADAAGSYPWYVKACAAGDFDACGIQGRMLRDGESGPARPEEGQAVARKGCDGLSGYACYEVAYGIWAGLGEGSDTAAAGLFALSCSLGWVDGCAAAGAVRLQEGGVPFDLEGGLWLLRFACDHGSSDGCMLIGDTYTEAELVDASYGRWGYEAACELGLEEGCAAAEEFGADVVAAPGVLGSRPWFGGAEVGGVVASRFDDRITPPPRSRPEGPSPAPRPPRDDVPTAQVLYGGLGTHRSWRLDTQASVLRVGYLATRGALGVGLHLDLVSDNRWQPKQFRTYRRTTLRADVSLALFPSFRLSAGGLVGGYTAPASSPVFQVGAFESLTLDALPGPGLVGARIEQTQYLAAGGLEHATALHMVLGGAL